MYIHILEGHLCWIAGGGKISTDLARGIPMLRTPFFLRISTEGMLVYCTVLYNDAASKNWHTWECHWYLLVALPEVQLAEGHYAPARRADRLSMWGEVGWWVATQLFQSHLLEVPTGYKGTGVPNPPTPTHMAILARLCVLYCTVQSVCFRELPDFRFL